jgi:hypothetical protein
VLALHPRIWPSSLGRKALGVIETLKQIEKSKDEDKKLSGGPQVLKS